MRKTTGLTEQERYMLAIYRLDEKTPARNQRNDIELTQQDSSQRARSMRESGMQSNTEVIRTR